MNVFQSLPVLSRTAGNATVLPAAQVPPAAAAVSARTSTQSGKRSFRPEPTQEQAHSWHFGASDADVAQMGEDFAREQLQDAALAPVFRSAAVCAKHAEVDDPQVALDAVVAAGEHLGPQDAHHLRREKSHRWSQPKQMYLVAIICSLSAAVMGMDETVVNGAMGFFKVQFGIADSSLLTTTKLGAICAAPYICCALLSCWLTQPLNRALGRRGAIVAVSVLSLLGCLFSALSRNAVELGLARAFLGLGIGPNSATTPMFAAECSPPRIRGALVMQWQVWTAFGIMMGYASSMAFYSVENAVGIPYEGANWRLMLASAGLPALVLIVFHWAVPESPRWYMSKGRYAAAWDAMKQLRRSELQAARDLFQAHQGMVQERNLREADPSRKSVWAQIRSLFGERRNRRAFVASEICMFLQQFSGVNIIAYYSSEIFVEAKMSHMTALGTSLGFGAVNFFFALPAFFTIDRLGRRPLLLGTIPFMALTLVVTACCFFAPEGLGQVAGIAASIYLFGVAYSSGAGPVPFTYSAEAYPLHMRPLGMSCATATAWFFNAMLALTWPPMMHMLRPSGAFMFYATTNVFAWFLVLFFVPETKNKTLEELDGVFDVSAGTMFRNGATQLARFCRLGRGRKTSWTATATATATTEEKQTTDTPTSLSLTTTRPLALPAPALGPELTAWAAESGPDSGSGLQQNDHAASSANVDNNPWVSSSPCKDLARHRTV